MDWISKLNAISQYTDDYPYTDESLTELRLMPKKAINPKARWAEKPVEMPVHRQRIYKLRSTVEPIVKFQVYQRQNIRDNKDFSCGIHCIMINGDRIVLARYNGSNHIHEDIRYCPHIHRATEIAIRENKQPETVAEATNRFSTVKEALSCLIEDFNVTGIYVGPELQGLFDAH